MENLDVTLRLKREDLGKLLAETRKWAKEVGLKRSDVKKAIKEARAEMREEKLKKEKDASGL